MLRGLAASGGMRIGVCWMLTPDDRSPDGKKTGYLKQKNRSNWRRFAPDLYDFLQRKVHGHETEQASRNVSHFNDRLLPNSVFWNDKLTDGEANRIEYFKKMWNRFGSEKVDLIFFDPDNGLANNGASATPRSKGRKESCKFLFRDEVCESLKREMSVLVYQHFDRTPRKKFIKRIAGDLMHAVAVEQVFAFVTPNVVFFLIPHPKHQEMLSGAAQSVMDGPWSAENSCKTSCTTEKRQILVQVQSVMNSLKLST